MTKPLWQQDLWNLLRWGGGGVALVVVGLVGQGKAFQAPASFLSPSAMATDDRILFWSPRAMAIPEPLPQIPTTPPAIALRPSSPPPIPSPSPSGISPRAIASIPTPSLQEIEAQLERDLRDQELKTSEPPIMEDLDLPEPEDLDPAPSGNSLELTLQDAVDLALEHNRPLKQQQLQRLLDRQDYDRSQGDNAPQFSPVFRLDWQDGPGDRTTTGTAEAGLTLGLPTGGTISVGRQFSRIFATETRQHNFYLTFNQPLWRNGGLERDRIPRTQGALAEELNQLQFQGNLVETISKTIFQYRNLVLAQENLEIERISLENVGKDVARTAALVQAGRLAPNDLLESQANFAERQLVFLKQQNNLRQLKLAFLQQLDIDLDFALTLVEIPPLEQVQPPDLPDFETLWAIAQENNLTYRQQQINLKSSELAVDLARDAQRWNVDFTVGYGVGRGKPDPNRENLQLGLVVKRNFGDFTVDQALARSQVNLEIQQIAMAEARDNLRSELRDLVANLQDAYDQVQSATRSEQLASQRLDNERKKYEFNLADLSPLDLINVEERVIRAKNDKLSAIINYANAQTRLQSFLGLLLPEWNVSVAEKDPTQNPNP